MRKRAAAARLAPALALALAVATPTGTAAQTSQIRGLSFGTVIAGTTTATSVTGPNAAMWQIRVTLVSVLGSFSLTLPSSLTRDGGGAPMPLAFCATCGRYRLNNNGVAGATAFNPSNTVTFSLLSSGTNVYVWLGGSVTPAANQQPGSYSGTVVLTTTGLIL